MPPTVRFQQVTKRFGDVTAVSGLDLTLEPGRIYGLLGPNGSGKTTTIRMMLGLLAPDEGEVTLLGGAPDQARRMRVGYVPEQRGLYEDTRVGRHLAYLDVLRGRSRRDARARAEAWLERLGLADRSHQRVKALSKGMQQKVQLALALMHAPELLVLDEPFTGLDPLNQEIIEDAVNELVAAGTTVILSTYQLSKAQSWVEHIHVLIHGHKVADGALHTLQRARRTGWLRLAFDGDADWLDGPGVAEVERHDRFWRVRPEGADGRAVLARAVAADVVLHRFEQELPTLHEIVVAEMRAAGLDVRTLEEAA